MQLRSELLQERKTDENQTESTQRFITMIRRYKTGYRAKAKKGDVKMVHKKVWNCTGEGMG